MPVVPVRDERARERPASSAVSRRMLAALLDHGTTTTRTRRRTTKARRGRPVRPVGTGGKSRSLEKDAAPRRFFTVLTVLEEIKGFVFDPIPLGHGGESIIITMARYDEEAGI